MPKVQMPQLGESVAEGTIGKWLKKPGDHVDKYEPIVEVITDKVNAEVPSPYEGTLTEILVQEGETVPNNTEIAVIEAAGEERRDVRFAPPAPAAAPEAPPTKPRRRPAEAKDMAPQGPTSDPSRALRRAPPAVDRAADRPAERQPLAAARRRPRSQPNGLRRQRRVPRPTATRARPLPQFAGWHASTASTSP